MRKLKLAPNMKQQPAGATLTKIVVGSQAWDFAKLSPAGRSAEQIALDNVLPTEAEGQIIPPIVLSPDELAHLTSYRIAPETTQSIEIYRANKGEHLSAAVISALSLAIAEQCPQVQTVVMYDEAESQLENLSSYIHRLRTDTSTLENAQNAAKREIREQEDKNKPYIEKRTVSGKSGLYRISPKYDKDSGELLSEREEWLSDCFEVAGIGRSEVEDYRIIKFTPEASEFAKVEALPMRDIGEREGWKQLRGQGLSITARNHLRNELADYIQNSSNKTLWRVTSATGWQNGAYLLPSGEVIGQPEKPVIFKSQTATATGYGTNGTLAEWQTHVAGKVKGNPTMICAIACALASPLLSLLEADSFGVHLFGGSSSGKTTHALLANSVWGHPKEIILSWNATAYGIQNEASARNDGFMTLDEIGQSVNIKHVEQSAYTLFNGVGKIQGAKDGGNREISKWRIVAFSTGELDVEGYLASKGVAIKAGQLIRLLNIPITPANCFHGLANGREHADFLTESALNHYGVAGREWIKCLAAPDTKDRVKAVFSAIREKWQSRLPEDAAPQVQRVASRFAILETALMLSTSITGWDESDCAEALIHCFNQWVNVFGLHSKEEQQVIDQVNGWLLANCETRFIEYPFNALQSPVRDIAGFRVKVSDGNDKEHFYVYKASFDEAIKGHPREQSCKILLEKGMLAKGERGYNFLTKIPHKISDKRTRCYLLFPLIETDEEE